MGECLRFQSLGPVSFITFAPYLHAMVCAIPSQVALFDVLVLSGQGLENLNQWRKKHGKSSVAASSGTLRPVPV